MSRQSSEMAARTIFLKKDRIICALVPQKARTSVVTSLEIKININSMAAHYDQDQKELKGTMF